MQMNVFMWNPLYLIPDPVVFDSIESDAVIKVIFSLFSISIKMVKFAKS